METEITKNTYTLVFLYAVCTACAIVCSSCRST